MIMSEPEQHSTLDELRAQLITTTEFNHNDFVSLQRGFLLVEGSASRTVCLLQTITDHTIKNEFSDLNLKQRLFVETASRFLVLLSNSNETIDPSQIILTLKTFASFLSDSFSSLHVLSSIYDSLMAKLSIFARYPMTQKPIHVVFDVRKYGTQCLVNLCLKPGSSPFTVTASNASATLPIATPASSTLPSVSKFQETVVSILVENLNIGLASSLGDESVKQIEAHDKLLVTVLKGIQALVNENKNLFLGPLAGIVVNLHSLILPSFSTGGRESSSTLKQQQRGTSNNRRSSGGSTGDSWRRSPSVGSVSRGFGGGSNTSLGRQRRDKQRGSTENANNGSLESDSEVSDGDSGSVFGDRYSTEKVQLNALYCLQALNKAHPKPIYSKWSLFLPPPPTPVPASQYPQQPSLFTLMDPSFSSNPKLRLAASLVLQSFLEGSQQYLSIAEDSPTSKLNSNNNAARNHSFTSLSEKLAALVCDLHAGLIKLISNTAIEEERDEAVMASHWKALSLLIKSSPYTRIQSVDLRGNCMNAILCFNDGGNNSNSRQYLSPRLNLIACLLDAGYSIPNEDVKAKITNLIYHAFLSSSSSSLDSDPAPSLNAKRPPASAATSEQLQISSLDALCAVIRNQFSWILDDWVSYLEPVVIQPVWTHPTGSLGFVRKVACAKVIEQFASSLAKMREPSAAMDKQEKRSHDSAEWDWWWSHVLKLYLKDGVRDLGYAVRAVSLQVLAHFPASIFQQLEQELQDFVKLDVVGVLAGDADEDVKSNCCLTVGLWVTLDYFIKDAEFIETLSRQLPILTYDKGVLVRVRSSWAVANLADTLLSLQQKQENRNILPAELLQPLVQSAIHSANDNEKCRSNGVRAVGNLLRLSPAQLYSRCFSPSLAPEIDAITKNISSGAFKVRWNACYAAYNLLQSPILLHILQNGMQLTSLALLFDALITALTKSKNFKVRINAAMALAGPPNLAIYCGKHDEILVCLRKVGETVDDDLEETKFGEFKYRKGLEEQVAKTLGYLEGLLVV